MVVFQTHIDIGGWAANIANHRNIAPVLTCRPVDPAVWGDQQRRVVRSSMTTPDLLTVLKEGAERTPSAAQAAKRMLRQAEALQAALVLPTWFTEITARGVEKAERVLVTT
jgi:hypothetical protein